MSPEKQRILIAKACGWVAHSDESIYSMWFHPKEGRRLLEYTRRLPDYLKDLNAIQSSWDSLGWEEKNAMVEHLKEIVKDASSEVYFATAAQRAEAFLKTLGLWEEKNEIQNP